MLNPIELAWSGLKAYVRENNNTFCISDVRDLSLRWIASVDAPSATAYIEHTRKVEQTFKESDQFTQQLEEDIIDDDEEVESENEETTDSNWGRFHPFP